MIWRYLGVFVITGTVLFWAQRGAHTGWTQTSHLTMKQDDVTGLDYPTYQKRLTPGLDVLVGGLLLGGVINLVGTFVARRRPVNH
jgi:hypothetical protein